MKRLLKVKIAISSSSPTLNSPVARHFGRCRYYLIVDTNEMGVDYMSNRAVFSICHVGMMLCVMDWLLVDRDRIGLTIALALFGLMGIFNDGQGIAQTRYLFGVIDHEHQTSYITVTSVLAIGTTGLTSLVGGAFLKWATFLDVHQGALTLNAYHVSFMVSALPFLIPQTVRGGLRTGREVTSAELIAFITRPLRLMLGAMVATVQDER